MQPIPAFNPGDTTTYPNGNGVINVGAADAGSKMLLYNESPFNINIDFLNGSQSILHAWESRYWTLDGDTRQVEWDINSALNVTGSPISLVIGELYGATEKLEGTYPMGLIRQANVGNVGGVATTGMASADFFNAKDTAFAGGAKGDNSTDDTAALTAANNAAHASGGILFSPPGTYITGNQTIYDNVTYMGAGRGATTWKLKSGSNTDLLSAGVANINLAGTPGTGPAPSAKYFGIRDMTLDGNLAGQTAGPSYPLRVYGVGYIIEHVDMINGYSGNALTDHYGPYVDNGEATWIDVFSAHSNGMDIQLGGPSSARFTDVNCYHSASHGIHTTQHLADCVFENCHVWGRQTANTVSWLIEGGPTHCANCEAEGSDAVQVVVLNSRFVWTGGAIFAGGHNGAGIQIGQQPGLTPYAGQLFQSGGLTINVNPQYYRINTTIENITNANGAVWFANDLGGTVDATLYSCTTNYTGTPHAKTRFQLDGLTTSQDIAGTTAGTAHCYEDLQGPVKRVIIVLDGYHNTTAVQQQFVLPVPFTKGAIIHVGATNTAVACWQGGGPVNINVMTGFNTFTPGNSIAPALWGEVTAAFDRVLLPDLMGSVVGRATIEIVGN